MFERHAQRFTNPLYNAFGEPHLWISDHLMIWVFGRVTEGTPGATKEHLDGNWLRVLAAAFPGEVKIKRVCDIPVAAIEDHMERCSRLLKSGSGAIVFDALAPSWLVTIRATSEDMFEAETVLASAELDAPRRFVDQVDRVMLRVQMTDCEAVLRRLERGTRDL